MREVPRDWMRRKNQRGSKIYRYGYNPELFWFIASLFVVAATLVLIIFPLSPWHLVIVPANLVAAAFYWRMSRMGARLDQEGVTIARMLRTIRIPWSQFSRFVIRPRPQDHVEKLGHVELTDGSLVFIQGMAPWGRLIQKHDDLTVDALIAEMNREARRLKDAAESTPPRSREKTA
jgi:hypothetical protein